MQKTYIAKSLISLNLRMGKNASRHISFESKSNGSAIFVTDNEKLQNALERHPGFGRLFRLKESAVAAAPAKKEPLKRETVEVTCPSDAKQYLVDKFEVSRTKLKTTQDILAVGEQYGITFKGI